MTYDSKSDRIILWGGDSSTNGNPDAPNDESVWAYDFNTNTWEERKATPAPVGRYASAIAYAAGADRTILYGGFQDGSSDMWAYDYNKNAWTELKPSDNPGSISWHEMVYLPETDRLFLFGGKLPNGYFSDKTWLYDYTANAWTVVTPKP